MALRSAWNMTDPISRIVPDINAGRPSRWPAVQFGPWARDNAADVRRDQAGVIDEAFDLLERGIGDYGTEQ
jgi:hypothetical protein